MCFENKQFFVMKLKYLDFMIKNYHISAINFNNCYQIILA